MNSPIKLPSMKNLRALFSFSPVCWPADRYSDLTLATRIADLAQDYPSEIRDYLAQYPATRHVDIYLTDIHGTFRGKRVAVESLFSLARGCYFPQSVYAMDREGKVLSQPEGDSLSDEPDMLCLPVPGTLRPCAHDPQHNAQLLLTMQAPDGSAHALEPRVILEKVLHTFHRHGLYPVVAPEIEFYLVAKTATPTRGQGCYQMAVPSAHGAFIEALETMATAQRLPLSGIVCEAEDGQFELNLRHSHRVVDICENVLALRRLTSTVAEQFGYQANFMAKPFTQLAGNGLHFHVSLNDIHGNNVFASPADELNEMARLCLAGMLHLMPASMAVMAPGVNAFRRLRKTLSEPLFNSWGFNKRSAALRIPCSGEGDRRIEYRLAGADANPYLVMATILTGMLYGLENMDDEAIARVTRTPPPLPLFQQAALDAFAQEPYLTAQLGEAFTRHWTHSRLSELAWFESIVTREESALAC